MDTRTLIRQNSNGTFRTPFTFHQTGTDSAAVDARLLFPIRNTLRGISHSNQHIIVSITGLFRRERPFKITLLIVSLIVYTFNGMLGRRLPPNRLKKVRVRVKTKLNTSLFIMGAIATLFGSGVRLVFGGFICFARFAMLQAVGITAFLSKASARLTLYQAATRKRCTITALAQAMPQGLLVFIQATKSDYSQIGKLLSRAINYFSAYYAWISSNDKLVGRHLFKTSFLNNLASRVDWRLNSFRPAFILT